MKKYQVTNGKKALGPVDNGDKAAAMLIQCLTVEMLAGDDPTKWRIEELDDEPKDEQPKDTPEQIPDYEAAVYYLNEEGVALYTDSCNFKVFSSLNKLLTLARAWNKADGFVPDWDSEIFQAKFYPIFERKDGKWEFKSACLADRICTFNRHTCFKTQERAEQFGTQFIDLFREALK